MTLRLAVPLLLEAGTLLDLTRAPTRGTGAGDFFPYLIGTAAVVVCVAGFFAWRHTRRRDAGGSLSPDAARLSPDQREKLDRAMTEGRYQVAGELLADAGRHRDAGESFARAGLAERAADAYESSGDSLQAIHYYKQAGKRRKAGKLYADRGDYSAAAAEFVEAGEPRLAAKYYEKGDDLRHAAQRYAAAGERRRAARNFEEAGEPGRAAREYERLLEHELEQSEGAPSDAAVRYGVRSGRCFAEAGEHRKAAETYERVGHLEKAAGMLVEAGENERAAELLLQIGQTERAVALLREAGADERAHRARGELAYESGEFREAAAAFEKSDDPAKAAKLYDKALDDPGRAAELYEKAERWLDAVDAYRRAGRPVDAAHCAEEGGDMATAAELYRDSGETDAEIRVRKLQGDYFRAGRLLYEHHRFEDALETLQRINSRDPIHSQSLELQGDAYRSMGRPEKAYSRYRAALGGRDSDRDTLPLHYKMARVMEVVEKWEQAIEHYDRVTAIDASYEDAAERRQKIDEGLTPGGDLEEPVEGGAESKAGLRATSHAEQDGSDADADRDVRYEFVEELARGGMGVVYRARDTFLNRIVAVKVLGEDLRDNERAVKYFLREARAAAALAHPNIVTIFDAGEQEGEYYIAMEYVDGETLKEKIKRGERLSEPQLRRVMIEACKALEYAHDQEVLHRDVKSGNIMYQRDGGVKVMDFGLAKFLREYQQNHTQQIGTPYYMSPEQIIGESIDFRADLYGLGCTAFECITGRVPFTEGELAYHHVHTDPPDPGQFNSGLSDDMEAVILKLLEKEPDDRFDSARDLREYLEH